MPINNIESFERDGTKTGSSKEGALTIHELWRYLKDRDLISKNTPILDFFYLFFPEEVIEQEREVYTEVTVAKRRTVFNRSNKYVNLTGSDEGRRFYEAFTELVLSYYGDIYIWCQRLLDLLIRNALRPEQRASITQKQLQHYKTNPPIQVKEFFAAAESYMEDEQLGLLQILLYGTDKPQWADKSQQADKFQRADKSQREGKSQRAGGWDYVMELTAIGLAAVYGPVILDYFENRPFMALPRIQTLIKNQASQEDMYGHSAANPSGTGNTETSSNGSGAPGKTSSPVSQEEIESRCSKLQKDFKNNEVTDFYRKWITPPFLHRKSNPPVTLEQLYLPPQITMDWGSNTDIADTLAVLSGKEFLELLFQPWSEEPMFNLIYITGQPGVGKTSFLSYLTAGMLQTHYGSFTKKYEKLLVISFKNLNREDLKKGLFPAIKKHTGCIDDRDYQHTLMILDGFDEIRMWEGEKRAALIEEFKSQISDLHIRAEGLCCILTSRDGYLPKTGDFNKDYGRNRHSAVFLEEIIERLKVPAFHLEPFDYDKIQTYNAQYNEACPAQPVPMPEFEEETLEKDCEIYGIPIILYMVHGTGLNVSSITDKNQLYDQLFSTENGQIYAKRDNAAGEAKYQREMILCYDAVACQLAYRMFELGTGPAIQTIEEREILWEKRIVPHLRQLLEERLGGSAARSVQGNLYEEQITACIASVKDSYVSFNYYYEGTHEEISDLEFVHKSIYEYYAGLYMSRRIYGYIRLLSMPEMKESKDRYCVLHAFAQQITALFCHHSLPSEIRASLYYHLQKRLSPKAVSVNCGKVQLAVNRKKKQIGFQDAYEQFHAGLQQLFADGIGQHLFLLCQNTGENLLRVFTTAGGSDSYISSYREADCSAQEEIRDKRCYYPKASGKGLFQTPETIAVWRYVPKDSGADLQLLHDTHKSLFCMLPGTYASAQVIGQILEETLTLDYYFYTNAYPDEQERRNCKRRFGMDGHGFDLAVRQAATSEERRIMPLGLWEYSVSKQLHLELSDALVENCCFTGVDFRLAKLEHTAFHNCFMQGVNLAGRNLRYTYFENTDLSGAGFQQCQFSPDVKGAVGASEERKHFAKCNLAGTNFTYASLSGVDLSTCKEMQSALFIHCNMSGVRIKNHNIKNTDMRKLAGMPVVGAFGALYHRDLQDADGFPIADWTESSVQPVVKEEADDSSEMDCPITDYFPINRFFTYDASLNRYLFPKGERILGAGIYFGRYPQSPSGTDTENGVAWQVIGLEEAEGRVYALLFADLVLDFQPYFVDTDQDMEWKSSYLYRYMNDDMLNDMFTEAEQACIADRGAGKLFLYDPKFLDGCNHEMVQALPELLMARFSGYAAGQRDACEKYYQECGDWRRVAGTEWVLGVEDYWTCLIHDIRQYLSFLAIDRREEESYETAMERYLQQAGLHGSEVHQILSGAEMDQTFVSYVRHKGFHVSQNVFISGIRPVMWLDVTHLFHGGALGEKL